jgi:hypothetical protein
MNMKKWVLILLSMFFLIGCAAGQLQQRVADLEEKVERFEDLTVMLEAAGVGAATRMYGRTSLIGGTKSVDNIACSPLADRDLVLVIDDDNQMWFYGYDDDGDDTTPGAENSPYIIEPDDVDTNCSGLGRWILGYGINFNSSTAGPGRFSLMEDLDFGYNAVMIEAPSSIGSDQVFTVGRWRVNNTTLVDPSDGGTTNLETDDTLTLFIMEEDGLSSGNHTVVLPAATGSGVRIGFVLYTNDTSYEIFIDPDGTDQIYLTNVAGDYVYAEVVDGRPLILWDCMSGIWCHELEDTDNDFAAAGSWQEQ